MEAEQVNQIANMLSASERTTQLRGIFDLLGFHDLLLSGNS